MATKDEVLYKIDYSTTRLQPDSKLCTIPDEVLLEIGKHVFTGFGLQFRYVSLRRLNASSRNNILIVAVQAQ